MFAKQLPLPVAARVWDGYFVHGELHVFKTAVALLRLLESQVHQFGRVAPCASAAVVVLLLSWQLMSTSASDCMLLLRSPISGVSEDALMKAVREVKLPPKVEAFYNAKDPAAARALLL